MEYDVLPIEWCSFESPKGAVPSEIRPACTIFATEALFAAATGSIDGTFLAEMIQHQIKCNPEASCHFLPAPDRLCRPF